LASYREVIKRSEFIGYAKAVFTDQEVHDFLQDVKAKHPKATHWVWAYKMGEVMFSSDAGEPSGSAGTPVLNAIRSSGLDYVMVVW